MALKKAVACTLTALALAGSAGGTAVADESKFNNTNCEVIELIDIPIVSSANNNIDCSRNEMHKEEENVQIVDKSKEISDTDVIVKNKGHHEYR